MKTAALTGGAGDGVYCIPIIKLLGIDKVYVKENFYGDGQGSLYSVLKPLYESQNIECEATDGSYPGFNNFDPALSFDVNLDAWRSQKERNRIHIIRNMMLYYRCLTREWNIPFLKNINHDPKTLGKNLIFLTWRWRDKSIIRWSEVLQKYGLTHENSFFIGHFEDYQLFCKETGHLRQKWIPRYITPTLLDMAEAINGCNRLFCNQGVALTLAQGLGKLYWLERKPLKTNTLFYTPNEHIL